MQRRYRVLRTRRGRLRWFTPFVTPVAGPVTFQLGIPYHQWTLGQPYHG